MPKTAKKPAKKEESSNSAAGTYKFDPETGRVVRVSTRIPRVASKGGSASAGEMGGCGRSQCGQGRCAGA